MLRSEVEAFGPRWFGDCPHLALSAEASCHHLGLFLPNHCAPSDLRYPYFFTTWQSLLCDLHRQYFMILSDRPESPSSFVIFLALAQDGYST